MENQKKQRQKLGKRVVLFPLPFQGHLRPMLHLANALYSKGFSITVIQTRFNSLDPSKFPNFTFHLIDDGLSNQPGGLPADSVEIFSVVRESCSEPFKDCLSRVLNDDSDSDNNQEPVSCLVADIAWEFAGEVADSFNLPKIALRCGSIVAAYVYESLPLLRENGYFPIQESRLEEPVLELPPLKVKDLPPEAHHQILTSFTKAGRTYAQGIICNAFEELEPFAMARLHQDNHPIPIFPIGPLNKYSATSQFTDEDQTSMSWLNTQVPNSVLYVSFGSVVTITETQFCEVAWGLANSMQPFLWVVRTNIIHQQEKDDLFPDGFLEKVGNRGRIIKWATQQEVLAHPAVGGFWTHCGWNSTLESICEGVPMICQPFFLDQIMSARYISDVWRIGMLLEKGLPRDEIERAIRRLMVEKEGEEMRERVVALKEQVNLCLEEGGSTYKALDKLKNHILAILNSTSNGS